MFFRLFLCCFLIHFLFPLKNKLEDNFVFNEYLCSFHMYLILSSLSFSCLSFFFIFLFFTSTSIKYIFFSIRFFLSLFFFQIILCCLIHCSKYLINLLIISFSHAFKVLNINWNYILIKKNT